MKTALRVILTLLFCVTLILCLAPSANAESGTWGDLNWTLDSAGKLTIFGSGAMNDFSSNLNAAWRRYGDNITSVVIYSGVSNIGDAAFYRLANIKSVTIPDSVTNIGAHAFSNCSSLSSIQLPSKLVTIGDYGFAFCSSL